MQQAYVNAYFHLRQFDHRAKFSTWLTRIAIHFVLREVDGLNTAETAEVLGVTEDAVKTRLSRSRAALRHQLAERAGIMTAETFRFPQPRCDRIVAAVLARIS